MIDGTFSSTDRILQNQEDKTCVTIGFEHCSEYVKHRYIIRKFKLICMQMLFRSIQFPIQILRQIEPIQSICTFYG